MPAPDPSTSTPTRARRRAAGAPSSAELGRRLRAAREARGLTQAQVAAALKIGHQTYAERERSTTLPAGALVELVKVAGYDPAILLPELFGDRRASSTAG